MTDPWRNRCPQGHASVTIYAESYKCGTCGEHYAGEPYDPKHTEFPVEDDPPLPKDTETEILAELVRRTAEPTTSWLRARQFDIGRPKQVGQLLAGLEDQGLVEKVTGAPRGHHWRPTEAGRQRVIETEREIALERGDRARATASPTAVGILTLLVGIVLLFGGVLLFSGVMV